MDYSNLQSRVSTSSSSSYIPPHRTQIHPRLMNSYSAAAPNPKLQQQAQNQQHKWIIVVSSLLTLPFVFYLFSTARKIHTSTKFQTPPPSMSYGVVIHSGTAGSRVRVFGFLKEGGVIPVYETEGLVVQSMEVAPGLVGFGEEPGKVRETISALVQFAEERVPVVVRGSTKVQLLAGEEMKSLGEEVREAILNSCREVLRSSGFWFKDEWASVIKGVDEGVLAWVAANYALGMLGRKPRETTGIVELGGAGMQIVYALDDPTATQLSRTIKYGGVTYNLSAQSLPQYGQDAAWQTLQDKQKSRDVTAYTNSGIPCLPRGYSLPSNSSNVAYPPAGNFSACRDEILNMLKERQGKCLEPPCTIISSPFSELSGKFVPPGNLLFTSEYFGVAPKATLSEVEAAGKEFCESEHHPKNDKHTDELDLPSYCFSSAYIVAMVHDVLGIKMNEKKVGLPHSHQIPLHWTLGAFILQAAQEPRHEGADNSDQIVGSDSITYFLLFSVLLILVLAAFFLLRWRRPQVKTIYDLEKGRYIVTRVPR
uniref:Apyrase n=1 Tax=Kalanchoe fedtschenkoi TaxID=63787 RepID=A0A7N0URE1_KALFE